MKKINREGFVLAETLVVTVFLMVLFAMIYSNFYPLVGEYEKREVYDDVDGKYSAYWLKQMIESAVYDIKGDELREKNFNKYGYVRFQCKDLAEADSRRVCRNLVSSLQVNGCDSEGNYCDIFVTNYRLGNSSAHPGEVYFKDNVTPDANGKINHLLRYQENCFKTGANANEACKTEFINNCKAAKSGINCEKVASSRVFSDGLTDYIVSLPDYTAPSLNYASYRVIAAFHNTKDNNNYYSYSTIEVTR